VTIDWQSLLVTSTAEIVRKRRIPDDTGAGVLWSVNPQEVFELSALEVMAWEGHEDKPDGPRFEWVGFNLLCNAAPTSFVLDDERFLSVDSFHEALKYPEDIPGRAECALAPQSKRAASHADFARRRSNIAGRSSRSNQRITRVSWLPQSAPRSRRIQTFRTRSAKRGWQD
jgi:hypothetical protein